MQAVEEAAEELLCILLTTMFEGCSILYRCQHLIDVCRLEHRASLDVLKDGAFSIQGCEPKTVTSQSFGTLRTTLWEGNLTSHS